MGVTVRQKRHESSNPRTMEPLKRVPEREPHFTFADPVSRMRRARNRIWSVSLSHLPADPGDRTEADIAPASYAL